MVPKPSLEMATPWNLRIQVVAGRQNASPADRSPTFSTIPAPEPCQWLSSSTQHDVTVQLLIGHCASLAHLPWFQQQFRTASCWVQGSAAGDKPSNAIKRLEEPNSCHLWRYDCDGCIHWAAMVRSSLPRRMVFSWPRSFIRMNTGKPEA